MAVALELLHDQIVAMTRSTRIAVLYKGRVQQFRTAKNIYDTPTNLFVATFMWAPTMNIPPVRVLIENGAPHTEISDSDGSQQLFRFSEQGMAQWTGRHVLLGLGPEAIIDAECADYKSGNIQHLREKVVVTEPAGPDTFGTMTPASKDVNARMRADASVVPGQAFDFNMDKAVFFDPESVKRITI